MKKQLTMIAYHGIIEVGVIENIVPGNTKKDPLSVSFMVMNESHLKFVHYPDCQQLIIWLPQPGSGYEIAILKDRSGKKIEEWKVQEKLNGSTQLIWDTVNWAPGNYKLEIDWKKGYKHSIDLVKKKEGVPARQKIINTKQKEKTASAKIKVYRDGFGKTIPNEDLLLRKKLHKKMAEQFGRHIEYTGNLRAGTVVYISGKTKIEFSHEMGGGNCMVYIDIPSEKDWVAQTKTQLKDRKSILEFVAKTIQAEQASNCRYEIKEQSIAFYYL